MSLINADVMASVAAPAAPPSATGHQSEWRPLPSTGRKPGKSRWRKPVVIGAAVVIALATVAGLSGFGRAKQAVDIQLFKAVRRSFPVVLQEKGELKAASTITVRSELEGRSTIIYIIPEGSRVKKGDLLIELASNEIDDKIRDGEIKVATAKAAYEAAEKELQILKDKNAGDIRKAEVALWLAEHALEKYEQGEAAQLKQTDQLALQKSEYVLTRAQKKLKDSEKLFEKRFGQAHDILAGMAEP